MKAIQYYGPQNIKYEEVMVKPPEEGEVVVKVKRKKGRCQWLYGL